MLGLERGSAGDVAKKHKIAAPKFLRIGVATSNMGWLSVLPMILLLDPSCRAADIETGRCEPSHASLQYNAILGGADCGIGLDLVEGREARLPGSVPLSLT